jgi:AcrR family transcriptional regulator
MQFQIRIQPSDRLVLRDPEETPLGRSIIRQGLTLMHHLGYEHFTFKKLADEIHTTEASIYRYFENKHRLLLYFLNWYWNFLQYLVNFSTQNMTNPQQKIEKVIELLVRVLPEGLESSGFDKRAIYEIVIAESSKTYLSRDVDKNNEVHLFKPYKDLCAHIAELFIEQNPDYPYPKSLASSLIELAHIQYYFMMHLPRLTDFSTNKSEDRILEFLNHFVFSALAKKD